MLTDNFQQVLSAARQLPKPSQLELASALLNDPATELQPLVGLSPADLHILADSLLASRQARRLAQLLRLNREKKLTRALRAELDELLDESDRVALLKARATYTLKLAVA